MFAMMTPSLRTLCAIGMLLAAGCGKRSGDAAATTQPGSSATVVVYTALEPEEVGVLKKQFEADHPEVKLQTVRASTGEVAAKLMAEGASTPADVVWGLAATNLLRADKIGLLAPYAPAGLDALSPAFRDARAVPHWVGIDGYMTAFAVNTAELAKAGVPVPTSYADLAKPAYKGMVSMPDPSQSGTGFLTVAGILQVMGEQPGWAYLDALNRNVAAYTTSGSAPATAAARGEHPIGISFDYRVLQEMKEGGPLLVVFPAEKSGWEMEANALIAKPTIKPAAKVFLDWAIGPKAFAYYGEHYGVVANPTYAHPVKGFPANPRAQMIDNNFQWAADNRDRILAEWKHRYAGSGGGGA
jgi:iron(III) transport system substrate-binding protein